MVLRQALSSFAMIYLKYLSILFLFKLVEVQALIVDECSHVHKNWNEECLSKFVKTIIPELEGKTKGDNGKVVVIGGSIEYTGAPYFAAISSLKVGADLTYVITTENAAPIIKSYSPDLIVIPYTSLNISSFLHRKDVVVLGPGLGRSPEGLNLAYAIINNCRDLKIPLVIDADGLFALYRKVSILEDFPSPGAILTPNNAEVKRLKQAIPEGEKPWYTYWGNYVTVLEKGENDQYHSSQGHFDWSLHGGGSGRRAGGQGDILSGALGTFLNWALNSNICENSESVPLAQSIASYAAAKFTRTCNSKAYSKHGRSMIASDMLNEIHSAFEDIFM